MADHHKIDKARKILELGKSATIPEIKEAYRTLSLKWHPDKCRKENNKECEEKIKEINNAKEILVEYCLNYRFHFEQAEDPDTVEKKRNREHMERFYDGWWADLKDE